MKTYSGNRMDLLERNGSSLSTSGSSLSTSLSSPLRKVEVGPSALIPGDKDELKKTGLVWSPHNGVDPLDDDGGNVALSMSYRKSPSG